MKFSKDFLPSMKAELHDYLIACGWWTLNAEKIKHSNADLWILAPYSFIEKQIQLVIISPIELLEKLEKAHGVKKTYNLYLWITKEKLCIDTRDLNVEGQDKIKANIPRKIDKFRNYSKYLNNIKVIRDKLKL